MNKTRNKRGSLMNLKRSYLEHIALFLIFLIITLPFYVADVMAANNADTINILNVSGESGMPNYRKGFDTTKINVEVIPNPDRAVQPPQVKAVVNNPGNTPMSFTTCVGAGGSRYICSFDSVTNTLDAGTYNFLVCGIDCQPCVPNGPVMNCRKPASITVDKEAPKVTSRSVTPQATNGGDFIITFQLSDG